MRRGLFGVVLLVGLLFAAVGAAEQPIAPMPLHWATDTAGFLNPQTVQYLDMRLRGYEAATHHQILLYVAPTTGDTPLEDWTVRAFQQWKVGRKGLDDGLVLFVFSQDRKVRIEVGYGLEGVVPDVIASRIIREAIVPWLKAGNPDRGAVNGISRILEQIGGENVSGNTLPAETVPLTLLQEIMLVVMGLVFLIVLVQNPWMAVYLLVGIFSGRGGYSSGGGGGFSGGGGGSGGGGASGGW